MPDAEVTASVLGRVIVHAGRVLDAPFNEVLERHKLTRNVWWLLTELYRTRMECTVTVGEHAQRAHMAPSSATIAAENLVSRGLVRRWRPAGNRRITLIAITDAGVALVELVRSDLESVVAGLYDLYDPEARQYLHDLLSRIVDAGRLDRRGDAG